jgi:hypothetical protein
MSANIAPGSFVRYRDDGPRVAKRGCVGLAESPSEEGAQHGWQRIGFFGSYEDYAPDELELARFWAVFDGGHFGPFANWDDAVNCVVVRMRGDWPFELNHPLGRKRNELIAEIEGAGPVHVGVKVQWEMGVCGIKVGGAEAPLGKGGNW